MLETVSLIFGILISAVAVLGGLWTAARKISSLIVKVDILSEQVSSMQGDVDKLEAVKEKVDTIWEFLMRRAVGRAIQSGLVEIDDSNGPSEETK